MKSAAEKWMSHAAEKWMRHAAERGGRPKPGGRVEARWPNAPESDHSSNQNAFPDLNVMMN